MSNRPHIRMMGLSILVIALGAPVHKAPANGLGFGGGGGGGGGVADNITITATQSLEYGRLAGSSGNSVTVDSNGNDSASGAIVIDSTREAIFTLQGDAGRDFEVTLPTATTVYSTNGDTLAIISGFTSNADAGGTFDAAGEWTLHVGATAIINGPSGDAQIPSDFSITVEYSN